MLEIAEIMKTKLMQFLSISCVMFMASYVFGSSSRSEYKSGQVPRQSIMLSMPMGEKCTIETPRANALIRLAIGFPDNSYMTENDLRVFAKELAIYEAWLYDQQNVEPDEDSFFYEFPRDVDQWLLKKLADVTREHLNKIDTERAKEEEAQRTKKANAFLKNMAVMFARNPHIGRDDLIAMVQDTREYLRVWQKDPQHPTVCSDNFLAELEGHPDIKLVQKLRDISLDRLSRMDIPYYGEGEEEGIFCSGENCAALY